jgi:predicted RNA-binding protein with PUA-like domain
LVPALNRWFEVQLGRTPQQIFFNEWSTVERHCAEIPFVQMSFWLMKSEPDEFSIEDLAKAARQTTPWFGVRNYTARNFMRDSMRVGDGVLFYHSSCPEPGIAGIVEIVKLAHPDVTQFDRKSPYFDAKSARDEPRWWNVDVKLVDKTRLVTLPEMRAQPALAGMITLRKGNRLSITPVTPEEWKAARKLATR